jgi:hypothetical protein
MTANFVARELNYRMTRGWGEGAAATIEHFRPERTFGERFGAMLDEITALGFSAIDLWSAHLDSGWATPNQIKQAAALLRERGLTVTSLAHYLSEDLGQLEGVNAIDPTGAGELTTNTAMTPVNATSKATLVATSGFGAVQNFTGFTNGTNILSFSDINLPDVQFSFSGSNLSVNTGSAINNQNFVTSPDPGGAFTGVRLERTGNNSVQTMTATITFGDWNGSAFTAATTGSAVAPRTVGFTFTGLGNRMYMFDSIIATFKDLSGGTLSTQSLTGLNIDNNATVNAGLIGYQGSQVGSVALTITTKATSPGYAATPIVGIDDFGFAVVPEPSTWARLAFSLTAMVLRRRRL